MAYPVPFAPVSPNVTYGYNLSPSESGIPYGRSPSFSEFNIERSHKRGPSPRPGRQLTPEPDSDRALQAHVDALLRAKARPSAISGRIPIDPSKVVLFFRSKNGVTHSLDFPIDVEYDHPPALNVLIAACKPHESASNDGYSDDDSLYYPPTLPLTTTLEIANHPILDAVRNALLPALPIGHYLTVVRDKLELLNSGSRLSAQPAYLRGDGRLATIIITLPVRFRGGALIVRDGDGTEETFQGTGAKGNEILWNAFLSDCDYEVERVQKGCRVSLTYGVFYKTLGPSVLTESLMAPSEKFSDFLSPILRITRGRKIGFYLANEYGVNPAESLADQLVPKLKGGDSLLYHALKQFDLKPELRWTAGGYIWPVDRNVECGSDTADTTPVNRRPAPAVRGSFGAYSDPKANQAIDSLRWRVEQSGAITLAEADIIVLTDWEGVLPVGKERVPFVASGELEKLVVNVLTVVYVP